MGQNVAVFFTKPSGLERVSLRRYVSGRDDKCSHPDNWGYHNAEFSLGELPARWGKLCDSGRGHKGGRWDASEFADHPGWPTRCACGYEFTDRDPRQVSTDNVMVREDGLPGKFSKRNAVVGMMWDCYWWGDRYESVDGGPGWINIGPDGLALVVAVPVLGTDGKWRARDFMPESRAKNCTRKDDGEHHCWVRHGDARRNQCHLDKNGNTCRGGAGSIVSNGWHGFIHHGFITDVPEELVR
jgi:hypothetical protein